MEEGGDARARLERLPVADDTVDVAFSDVTVDCDRVDVEGLLGTLGERGQRLQAAVDQLEDALETRDLGYVSVLARFQ